MEDSRLVEQTDLECSFELLVGPDACPGDFKNLANYRIRVLGNAFEDRQEDVPMLFQKC